MLSNLDPSSQSFLADLNRIQSKVATAQQQISSGLRVQSASDAPDQIGTLLQLESQRTANKQTSSNLTLAQTESNAADNALTSAIQLLDKITQIAGQGLSSAIAPNNGAYAQQIQDLQGQMVSLTWTTVDGRYIFDGGAGSAPPYQADPTSVNGAIRLSSSPATRQLRDSSGTLFQVARSAQDIFDHRDALDNPAPDNVLAAIGGVRTALLANDAVALSAAIDTLHASSAYLAAQQSFYGTVEDRLSNSISAAQSKDISLQTEIGALRDADMTEATLSLNAGNIQEQAALAARARASTKSLFDYLA